MKVKELLVKLCGEIGTLIQCWWECKLYLFLEHWMFPQKMKNRIAIRSSSSASGYIFKEIEVSVWKRRMQLYIYSSAIHSSQDMEVAEVPLSG